MHGAPNYTPHQIIEAGQRAEADGQLQYAMQFYRHVLENYAASGEAGYARERLMQLEQGLVTHHDIGAGASAHGAHHAEHLQYQAAPARGHTTAQGTNSGAHDALHAMPAIARPRGGNVQNHTGARAQAVTAPRDAYRLGRFVARVLTIVGWLSFILGGAAVVVSAVVSAGIVPIGTFGFVAAVLPFGSSAAAAGFVMIFFGQFARASFDTANATRELVAIARTKSGASAQNGQRH